MEKSKQFVEFLGAVHDLGKATPAFQTMKGFKNSQDLDEILLEKLENSGFAGVHNLTLASPEKTHHSLAGQTLLYWSGVGEDVATIIGSHHGKPIDLRRKYRDQGAYASNYFQNEKPDSSVYQKWQKTQSDILLWALESNGFRQVSELPKIKQPAQVLLTGLLIMADWIASNEHYFPLLSIEESNVNQDQRVEKGWLKWYKTSLWEADYYNDVKMIYNKRFGFDKPRDVQITFSELIDDVENPGIFILEAPMGVGKTEAALAGVEQLAYKMNKNGLFFCLPTQATSNGIFPRILHWVESLKDDGLNDEDKMAIRLMHGKAALNEEFSSLASNINVDGESTSSVIINEWFSGHKKSSLDDFVVGTVDQFLLVALKQKHVFLRHLGFSKKVVVIDEVHAYDAYMSQYLLQAIKWMGAYEVPVIILSATLSSERREDLVSAYLLGRGVRHKEIKEQLTNLSKEVYPLVTYSDANKIKQASDFKKMNNTNVRIHRIHDDSLYGIIDNLMHEGGIIGLVVNTVKRAQKIAEYCVAKYGEDCVELIHSGFIATDRIIKEEKLINMIGKGAIRPKQKIIIGTQVIEQSLDIDFDTLISDLAPMDLIIQRIGRLHRHVIKRPKGHEDPTLFVIGTDENFEFEKGSEAIYGGYLLARTQYFLPDMLSIPEDISTLVQKVYSDTPMQLRENLLLQASKMKEEQEQKLKRKTAKAKTYRIDAPIVGSKSNECSLIGWLDNLTPNASEERAYAQVRDTEETIEVIALKKINTGYGFFEEKINLEECIDDFDIGRKVAQHTLKLPNILSTHCRIDQTIQELEEYYVDKLFNWQNQSWLKGKLGIIFNEENEFFINGFKLVYSEKFGLSYERM